LGHVYVFEIFRRRKIAKTLIESNKVKIILTDEPTMQTRNLFSLYFQKNTIYGYKDEYEWRPENESEKKRLSSLALSHYFLDDVVKYEILILKLGFLEIIV
jgi:hypothetical protein